MKIINFLPRPFHSKVEEEKPWNLNLWLKDQKTPPIYIEALPTKGSAKITIGCWHHNYFSPFTKENLKPLPYKARKEKHSPLFPAISLLLL